MLRSMYSGISGMRGFQTKLDVIGNNIANVNTTGFKAGRVMFKDVLSQTTAGAAAPTAGALGGINPRQIGLGSTVSSIDTIHTQGSFQTTNVPTDMMVNGDGFFILSNGAGKLFYTRAGNFTLDAGTVPTGGTTPSRFLVAPNGMKVQGTKLVAGTGAVDTTGAGAANGTRTDIQIPADAQSYSIDDKGVVSYIDSTSNKVYVAQIQLANFSNPGGLQKAGDSLYTPTSNSGTDAGIAIDNVPGSKGRGQLVVGVLEMSNVDLSNEFTEMIVAQRGFQANTKIITTSDEILQELVNLKR